MSEFLAEEDPDPFSEYPENYETGLRYEGYELSRDLREREARYLEKIAIERLSKEVDNILLTYGAVGDFDDIKIREGDVLLRRRITTGYWPDGREKPERVYFFVDQRDERNYCRSWSSSSEQVNWCIEESRHEPADDVTMYIREIFPVISKETAAPQRSFGGRILQLLGR